ncbi:sigma-70 family RNA polymerase sigma factor [Streptomyces sp. NPDC059783]|uniref:sigma-70 family RNA polymerase sigma factor n=1 Tax=Streptomyces sp. NPDC059783 TaxID=3346944 RepID=UPI0036502D3A
MTQQHTVDPVALVTAALRGEPGAKDALAGAYLPLVYNVVGRALNGSADVDDVVQETMLRALDGLHTLRAPENFRSWLVAIAMNQVRSHWQDRRSAPGALEEAGEFADPGADFVDLTMMRLQLSWQRQETARATRWLEPDDQGLLSLWWLECAGQLDRSEVAEAMRLSPQHTAVRVQRMKAQLEAARVVVRALDARPCCEELRVVLGSWDGRPSALWRKRIARHARECLRCSGLWSGLMPAEGLLAGLALVPLPAALLALWPAPDAAAATVAQSFDATVPGARAGEPGIPAAPGRHRSGGAHGPGGRAASRADIRRRRRLRRRAAGGAVAVVCIAGGGLWYASLVPGSDGATEVESAAGTPSAPLTDLAASGTPGAASPSATTSPSPSPSPSAKKRTSPPPSPKAKKSSPAATPTRTSAPRTSSAPAPRPTPAGAAAQVVALVNKERAAAGCGPVTENAQLTTAAQRHSDDMAARGFFEHTNPDGADPGDRITAAGYRWSTYGENIAAGQQTPEAVMNAWMNSPGHRANILNCSFKELGVGIHRGSGGPWWTQDFGAGF